MLANWAQVAAARLLGVVTTLEGAIPFDHKLAEGGKEQGSVERAAVYPRAEQVGEDQRPLLADSKEAGIVLADDLAG